MTKKTNLKEVKFLKSLQHELLNTPGIDSHEMQHLHEITMQIDRQIRYLKH